MLAPPESPVVPSPETGLSKGWRHAVARPSLPEIYRSLPIPQSAGFLRKLLAFAGPGYLVAVGYMDPGNWATDLAGGSKYNYSLLSVIMMSNLMAILLQTLAIKLGVVTGRDLAVACRDHFSRPVSFVFWIGAEIAIAACDLAEVIGSAIALNLLFHIPLLLGVCLTALDVFLILFLQQKGFRLVEALVISLIGVIGVCFGLEILFSRPNLLGIAQGFFIPSAQIIRDPGMLYIAIGILGATVMPHNLYLHSALVQTRNFERTPEGKREAIRFGTIDSTIALSFALLVNAAILIVSAATFLQPRIQRRGRDQRRPQIAHSAARSDRSQHHVRTGPAGFRPEFHPDRHAGRPGRHGRLPEYSSAPLAAPLDHSLGGDCSGGHRHCILGNRRHRQTAGLQPGHFEYAVKLRRLSPGDVYQRPAQDG